jgi:2-keto-4-pentenoate hydratase
LAETGVEVEFAFRLARAFPAAAVAPSRGAVEDAIASCHVVLEICASRLAEGLKAPPLLQLADAGSNLGLIIGPQVTNWRAIGDTAKGLLTALTADGAVIAETTGGHSTGDLPALLHWLVGHCVTKRGGLAAGSLVTTGSWMGIRWVKPPVRVAGRFAGIGTVEAELVR